MRLIPRILISLPVIGRMCFSAFGFRASFEYPFLNVWHAIYSLAFLLLAGVTRLIWRRPRNP